MYKQKKTDKKKTKYEKKRFRFWGLVSKPLSKRTENVSFATLSGDLKGGAHDRIIVDPFSFNGSMHKAEENMGCGIRCE